MRSLNAFSFVGFFFLFFSFLSFFLSFFFFVKNVTCRESIERTTTSTSIVCDHLFCHISRFMYIFSIARMHYRSLGTAPIDTLCR